MKSMKMIPESFKTSCQQGLNNTLDWAGRHLPLRHRHMLTRGNRLRLRYVVSPLALMALAVPAISALHSYSMTTATVQLTSLQTPATVADGSLRDQASSIYAFYQKRLERYGSTDQTVAAPAAAQPVRTAVDAPIAAEPARPAIRIFKIGSGDTLTGLLEKAGVATDEAYQMVQALKHSIDPRNLKVGQKLSLRMGPADQNGAAKIAHIDMPIDAVKSISLEKANDGTFKAAVVQKPVATHLYAKTARIETSLYGSASKAGIPSQVIADLIKVYSYDVDFQRDLQKGDVAQVMYNQVETNSGEFVKQGDLVFARLVVGGRVIPIYRYTLNGNVDYFTPEGKSVRKALMRTPVDGARISSGFGMRVHPVLGFTKMHKGEDFAAPIGTPIYAAGNGVVEKCGPFSTYGNYIKIRHNASMETAYAHMSRFANGIHSGDRVRQGEVIGFIGRTGRVTGAHLHYEVLIKGTQVNPAGITMAQADALQGKQLSVFRAYVAKLNQQFSTVSGALKTASSANESGASSLQ